MSKIMRFMQDLLKRWPQTKRACKWRNIIGNTKIQCQNFKNFIQLISLNIVQSEYFLYPKALLKYHQQNSFNSLSYKHIVIFTRTDRESAHVVLIFILHFHRPGLSLTCLGEKDFALRQNQINKKNAKISWCRVH